MGGRKEGDNHWVAELRKGQGFYFKVILKICLNTFTTFKISLNVVKFALSSVQFYEF